MATDLGVDVGRAEGGDGGVVAGQAEREVIDPFVGVRARRRGQVLARAHHRQPAHGPAGEVGQPRPGWRVRGQRIEPPLPQPGRGVADQGQQVGGADAFTELGLDCMRLFVHRRERPAPGRLRPAFTRRGGGRRPT